MDLPRCRAGQGATATQTHQPVGKYENRISKSETKPDSIRLKFSFSYFGFVSDFEIWISNFPHCGGSVSLSLLDAP